MTTSWAYFARGQFAESMATNFAGFLLAWLALFVGISSVFFLLQGKAISRKSIHINTIAAILIFAIAITNWLWRHII
jgi:hypothetical protein